MRWRVREEDVVARQNESRCATGVCVASCKRLTQKAKGSLAVSESSCTSRSKASPMFFCGAAASRHNLIVFSLLFCAYIIRP